MAPTDTWLPYKSDKLVTGPGRIGLRGLRGGLDLFADLADNGVDIAVPPVPAGRRIRALPFTGG